MFNDVYCGIVKLFGDGRDVVVERFDDGRCGVGRCSIVELFVDARSGIVEWFGDARSDIVEWFGDARSG